MPYIIELEHVKHINIDAKRSKAGRKKVFQLRTVCDPPEFK